MQPSSIVPRPTERKDAGKRRAPSGIGIHLECTKGSVCIILAETVSPHGHFPQSLPPKWTVSTTLRPHALLTQVCGRTPAVAGACHVAPLMHGKDGQSNRYMGKKVAQRVSLPGVLT